MPQPAARPSPILDAHGQPLARADTAYEAASRVARGLADYQPRQVTADAALARERPAIATRIDDLIRNDPVARAAIQREVDAVVGAGLRLSAKPDHRALGIEREQAEELGRAFETVWRLWGEDPGMWADAQRQSDIHGLFARAYRSEFTHGEALAILLQRPRRGALLGTTVQLVHVSRLSNPDRPRHDDRLRDGVEIGPHGEARWYHIRDTHPGDDRLAARPGVPRWRRIPRETRLARPIVVHSYEPTETYQHRGVSPFAAVVKKLRMLARHGEAELEAAVVNAILGAFITTHDQAGIAEALGADIGIEGYNSLRQAYHEEAKIRLNGARLPVLFPGERIEHAGASRPNTAFAEFEAMFLRLIASALGQSYEEMAMDWTQTTYSSARAALNEIWRGRSARRARFVNRFVLPIYAAVVEEAIGRGLVRLPAGAPRFREARGAYCRARWIGPGRGYVDPVKEAQGAQARIDMMISTLEDEAAELGRDWEDIIEQRAREQARLAELGLEGTTAGALAGLRAPTDSEENMA